MSGPATRGGDELPRSASVFHAALAYVAAHGVGLAGIACCYEGLRAWAVDGPLLSCTVRVPLLVTAGVVAELSLLVIGARLATR